MPHPEPLPAGALGHILELFWSLDFSISTEAALPGGCVVTCLSYRSVAREKVTKPPEGHLGPQRTDSSVPVLEE